MDKIISGALKGYKENETVENQRTVFLLQKMWGLLYIGDQKTISANQEKMYFHCLLNVTMSWGGTKFYPNHFYLAMFS